MPTSIDRSEDTTLYNDTHLFDTMNWGGPEPFYFDAAVGCGGPVLELGCGTGRMLVPMAEKGVDITGIDLSGKMLAAAHGRLETAGVSATLIEGDMSRFEFAEPFALVFSGINSLLHLTSVTDLRSCFRCVRRALRPDGRFLFDIFNVQPGYLATPPDGRRKVGEFESDIYGRYVIEETVRYDAAMQIAHKTFFYSAAGAPDFRVVTFPLRVIYPLELEVLLAIEGLRLEARYGDRSGTPFYSESPSQVCIAVPA